MGAIRKFTNEDIIAAYQQTGSVWRAAKRLGACGQSVWERLKRLGYEFPQKEWDEAEEAELRALAPNHTITEIAQQLGRSYSAVASRISILGLGVRYGNRIRTKFEPGKPIGEETIRALFAELLTWGGSVRQFWRHKRLPLERFVIEVQRHMPADWDAYARSHSALPPKTCPQCSREFIPMTDKQVTCTRACASDRRNDLKYFDGKRSSAVGIADGTCQICGKTADKRIAAHHVFGKENDPNHEAMIALCNGCHQILGVLAGHPRCADPELWESLIAWALMRHYGQRKPIGFHVWVEVEELAEEDLESDGEQAGAWITVAPEAQ